MNKERLSSILWTTLFIAILAGLIGYIVWDISRPLAGTKVSITGRKHVPEGTKPTYTSNPPTSGDHYGKTEEWGIYDRELVAERLVHNLEHGGIVILYKCPSAPNPPITEAVACEKLIKQLKEVTNRLIRSDRKVVLAPDKVIDAKIALSAWGWYDTMNEMDEDRIWRFFKDHINNGPERTF